MLKDKEILVIGATQGTGFEAAKLLLDEGASVRIFARNAPKARERFEDDVRIIPGDLRKPDSMPGAVKGADHIVFTAGVTKRPCSEELIIETEFEGMKSTLETAMQAGFTGRFVFLSSIGVTRPNWASRLLNKIKGNALEWRKAMEDQIRESGFDYTIVRAGYLMNSDSRKNTILTQGEYALDLRHRIGRIEAARVIVAALEDDRASRKTFNAVRGKEAGANGKLNFAELSEDR